MSKTSTANMDKKSKYFGEFTKAKADKTSRKLYELFRLWDNFKMGYQWVGSKNSGKAKPVNNVCGRIVNYKVPAIASNNIEFNFEPEDEVKAEKSEDGIEGNDELFEIAEMFSRYANAQYLQMEMKTKNEKMADNAATVGSGYIHFYWDNNVIRGNSEPYIGVLCSEVINSMNYYPKVITESDVQKQPSFILEFMRDVETVKMRAKANNATKAEIDSITPTTKESKTRYSGADNGSKNANEVATYRRYWKKQEPMPEDMAGKFAFADPTITKVYWCEFTEGVDIEPEQELEGHSLYPMDGMVWRERTDFAFGQGEVETIVPNQKAINLIQGMQIEVIKKLGMPPVVVNDMKYKGKVSYDSGAVYRVKGSTDDTIRVLPPGQFNPQTFDLFNTMVQSTKDLAGATEDALGERTGSDLNATAIALQQKASSTPLKPTKSLFDKSQRRFGMIMMEFWINQFTKRVITYKNKDGEKVSKLFDPEKYKDMRFDLEVQVTSTTDYSDELDVSTLNKLFDAGNMTKEQYVMLLPKQYASFKDRLLVMWEEEETQDIMIIIGQLNELNEQGRLQDFFNQPPDAQIQFIEQVRESIA